MRISWQVVAGLCLCFAVVVRGGAEEKVKGAAKPRVSSAAAAFNAPAPVEWNDEQKKAVEELKNEYETKLSAAFARRDGIYTFEQKKARNSAQKAAKAAGKTPAETREAVTAAVQLTDEQKKDLETAEKELQDLQKVVRGKITELLTPDQRLQIRNAKKKKKA